MDNPQWQALPRPIGPGEANPRYQMLDAWRGLACLLVVVHHAGFALTWAESGGSGVGDWARWLTVLAVRRMNLGVSLFFVISGYCIAASAVATARKGGSARGFMGRRFWRIYPPYWAALLVFVAVVLALDALGLGRLHSGPRGVDLGSPASLEWGHWLGNLTLTETWRPYVWGPPRDVYTSVAWSLCFEEQFYLICFLALWLAPGRLMTALGGVTLGIVAVRVGFWWWGGLGSLRGTFPLLWHEFAVGLAVYYRLNLARRPWERRAVDLGLLAMLLTGLATGGEGTIAASAFGLVLVALRRWDVAWSGSAWLAPFLASGRRCYSIYLVHLPVVVVGNHWLFEVGLTGFWARALVMVPLVSAVGVGAGWAFHGLIESHFLNPPLDPNGLGHAFRMHARRLRALSGSRAAYQRTA